MADLASTTMERVFCRSLQIRAEQSLDSRLEPLLIGRRSCRPGLWEHDLFEDSRRLLREQPNSTRKLKRFIDIMRDQQRRQRARSDKRGELLAYGLSERRVERRERLVEQ